MASPRMIQLVYLARLREALGSSGEAYSLPEHVTTVDALRRDLAARGGAWASELAPQRVLRIAVNHDVVRGDGKIGPGDEVAFFPPVTGG